MGRLPEQDDQRRSGNSEQEKGEQYIDES